VERVGDNRERYARGANFCWWGYRPSTRRNRSFLERRSKTENADGETKGTSKDVVTNSLTEEEERRRSDGKGPILPKGSRDWQFDHRETKRGKTGRKRTVLISPKRKGGPQLSAEEL